MKIIIEKSVPHGSVGVPPSKSFSHRALICAALSGGESVIRNISVCDDVLKTADCLCKLGASVKIENRTATVKGIENDDIKKGEKLDCGDSASTFRFLLPVAAALGTDAELSGSKRLFERVRASAVNFLAENGCACICGENSIKLNGGFTENNIVVDCSESSQLLSGVLMALPLADCTAAVGGTLKSAPYIDMTVQTLKAFGVAIAAESVYSARGGYAACEYTVENDWSSGAFVYALAARGDAEINGLNSNSVQGDSVCADIINGIVCGKIHCADVTDTPDLFPVLAAVAALNGGCTFTGTYGLHNKESDRIRSVAQEFAKFGVSVTETENSVTVGGGAAKPQAELCAYGDHRIVMALTVLCTALGGTVNGAECAAKSLPEYFEILDSLNIKYRRC